MQEFPPPLPRPFVGQKGHRVPNGTPLVTVYVVATGEAIAVKPISAKEGVAAGVWSRTPPAVPEPVVEPVVEESAPAPPKTTARKRPTR